MGSMNVFGERENSGAVTDYLYSDAAYRTIKRVHDEIPTFAELLLNLPSLQSAYNYQISKAAGEAATEAGDLFSYPDGTGRLIYAARTADGAGDAGGNSVLIGEAATVATIAQQVAAADTENRNDWAAELQASEASLAAPGGSALVGFQRGGVGKAARTVASKVADTVDLRDWNGLDLTGNNDNTSIVMAAATEVGQGRLWVPKGRFLVSSLPLLHFAGIQIVGESKWLTIFQLPELIDEVLTGSLFHNAAAATSSHVKIENMLIDLRGQDVAAIDANNLGDSIFENIHIIGGPNKAGAAGVGVLFRSTLESSSYTNAARSVSGEYLERGIAWDAGGNENGAHDCRMNNCIIGFDMLPGSNYVDTPTVFGGRVEGCDIGLRDGAINTSLFGLRFENSTVADVEFHAGQENSTYLGCYTAASETVFKDQNLSNGVFVRGGRFPQVILNPDVSNPPLSSGRHTFAPAGVSPTTSSAGTGYAAFFQGEARIKYSGTIEFENYNEGGSPNGTVLFANIDTNRRISIPGYDRVAGVYRRIFVGPNFNFNPDVGLEWAGIKVVGAPGAAVGDAAAATYSAPAVTYAAAAGGATIDAEARASLAQAAADLAEARTAIGQLATDNASIRTAVNAILARMRAGSPTILT